MRARFYNMDYAAAGHFCEFCVLKNTDINQWLASATTAHPYSGSV